MTEEHPAAAERQPLIVVADDDELIRTVLQFALESLGFGVIEASRGADAVELAREHSVDLVILDVNFPGEDFEQNWEALNAIPAPRPAVILLSGDSQGPAVTNDSGVEFLRKPVELAELQASVARMLSTAPRRELQ
jgi:CheY-like chemotaxis protein